MATIMPIEAAIRYGLTPKDVQALARAGRLRVWALKGRQFLDPRKVAEVVKERGTAPSSNSGK